MNGSVLGIGNFGLWNMDYDFESQLLNVVISPQGGAMAKALTYEYDGAGNRTAEQTETTGANPTFATMAGTYNNVNQLTTRSLGPVLFRDKINEPGTVTINGEPAKMTQDPDSPSNGKIFTKSVQLSPGQQTVVIVAEDMGTNRGGPLRGGNTATSNYTVNVAGGVVKNFGYDLNGNCTNFTQSAGPPQHYEWDAEDRLVAVSKPPFRHEFTYDGFGRRVKVVEKLNGAVTATRTFLWCGKELCEERNVNGATVTKRFFADGEWVVGIGKMFFTRDHLGSVREVISSDGTGLLARYDYDPYGRRSKVGGSPFVDADFGYTGHYYHAMSGLHLALYRAYDADTGRWPNRDPIGEEGGLNLYGYVENDPVNAIDLLGLRDFTQEEIDSGIREGVSGLLVRIRQTQALREHDIDKWKELERGSKQIGSVGKTLGISCTADDWEHSWGSWALTLAYTPGLLAASLSGEEELLSTYTESELMRQTFYLKWLSEQKPKPGPSATPKRDK